MSGIDYGMGRANIDKSNGIRYGVISINSLSPYVWDGLEADYGPATCPKCGNELKDPAELPDWETEPKGYKYNKDHYCDSCDYSFDSEEAFGDEPLGYTFDDGKTVCQSAFDNTELFITKSPYFTFSGFCSPCAPGAADLNSSSRCTDPEETDGAKCYCLGEDWFDEEENPCPYCYWSVETGELVYRPENPELVASHKSTHHGNLSHEDCPLCKAEKK